MDLRHIFSSPLGIIRLTEENGALTRLEFVSDQPQRPAASPLLLRAEEELTEYFAGKRTVFDLPLRPAGTAFQRDVWQELLKIPYGRTCSYAELAARLNRPRACRAVGGANGRNPLPILIPCHRVISARGGLGGYSCGLERKQFLLTLEKNAVG